MELFEEKIKSNGGVCGSQLDIVRVSSILNWPEEVDLKQLTDITLSPGEEWITIPFVRGSITPNEPTVINGGTKYYKHSLPGTVNGVDNAIRSALLNLEDTEVVIRFKTLNADTYIIGSPSFPASMQVLNRKIGGSNTVRNDISLLITSVSKQPFNSAL